MQMCPVWTVRPADIRIAKFFRNKKKEAGEFEGPTCAYRLLDMGIALGSAVKTASMLNVDNRIMHRVGVVTRELGIVDWDFVMGIPLSVTGKSIYIFVFD